MIKILIKRLFHNKTLELHVTDHCNLNCKSCSHYAPVADEFYISLEKLEEYYNNIKNRGLIFFSTLRLMGGEPLLHPYITEIIELSRTYFSDINIVLISNGIIIKKMSQKFWDVCQRNNIIISITKYPININYNELMTFVKNKNIQMTFYGDNIIPNFRHIVLDDQGKQNPFKNYFICYCGGIYLQLREGKIYSCSQSAYISIINKRFGMEFKHENNDYLLLNQIKSIKEIKKYIFKPKSFCRYCNLKMTTWNNQWEMSKRQKSEWL
ncbi:radical SAM protein [Thomasclavelia cocleata]|uniref:radical SAM protein n=1 Tax=Thomasclavelia cocleata TaxID=69824 RepID=UPI00255AE805|nr:radical SAM protein [Thomasclavelia cocleata]